MFDFNQKVASHVKQQEKSWSGEMKEMAEPDLDMA
jgi:hypothetical protein